MFVLRVASCVLASAALAACRSTAPDYPAGDGLASVDREAPPGVDLYPRPQFQAGDWFTYRRGGLFRLRYRVVADPNEAGYLLVDEDADRALVMDRDLAMLGEGSMPRENGLVDWSSRLDPLDPSFTWPLWVGKRWSGDFVQRDSDGSELPLKTYYEVIAKEELTTPAGTFETLRIERRSTPALEAEFIDRLSVLWYAPEVGYVVRRLEDGIETELEEFQRQ